MKTLAFPLAGRFFLTQDLGPLFKNSPCHARASGDPENPRRNLDSRFRENDRDTRFMGLLNRL